MWGKGDEEVPLSIGYQMRELMPAAELSVIEHAGHFAFKDQPAEFCRITRKFLNEAGNAACHDKTGGPVAESEAENARQAKESRLRARVKAMQAEEAATQAKAEGEAKAMRVLEEEDDRNSDLMAVLAQALEIAQQNRTDIDLAKARERSARAVAQAERRKLREETEQVRAEMLAALAREGAGRATAEADAAKVREELARIKIEMESVAARAAATTARAEYEVLGACEELSRMKAEAAAARLRENFSRLQGTPLRRLRELPRAKSTA